MRFKKSYHNVNYCIWETCNLSGTASRGHQLFHNTNTIHQPTTANHSGVLWGLMISVNGWIFFWWAEQHMIESQQAWQHTYHFQHCPPLLHSCLLYDHKHREKEKGQLDQIAVNHFAFTRHFYTHSFAVCFSGPGQ